MRRLEQATQAPAVEWQILTGLPHAQHAEGKKGGDAAGETEDALLYRFEGPLFFGVASTIFDALERIDPPPPVYVIDFHMVPFIDGSAAESFFAFAERAHKEGRRIVVAGARSNVRSQADRQSAPRAHHRIQDGGGGHKRRSGLR